MDHAELKNEVAISEITQFYKNCQAFLIEAVSQIKKRFALDDAMYDVITYFNPRSAISLNPPSLLNFVKVLPKLEKFVDKKLLDEEWRAHYLEEELSSNMKVL